MQYRQVVTLLSALSKIPEFYDKSWRTHRWCQIRHQKCYLLSCL